MRVRKIKNFRAAIIPMDITVSYHCPTCGKNMTTSLNELMHIVENKERCTCERAYIENADLLMSFRDFDSLELHVWSNTANKLLKQMENAGAALAGKPVNENDGQLLKKFNKACQRVSSVDRFMYIRGGHIK